MKKLLFVLASSVAFVSSAQAQIVGGQIEVGAFGQQTTLDSKLRMDNVLSAGGRVGVSVFKWIGAEADIQLGRTQAQRDPFEKITYRPFHGFGTITVPLTPSHKAGLVLGGGYLLSVFSGRATTNEYEDGFSMMAGLKICANAKWGVRLDGILDNNPSPNEQGLDGTSRNLGLRAGVTYALRGACATEEKFDWQLKIDPASATVNRGANRQFALSAVDLKERPIEIRKVMNLACSSSDPSVATVDNSAKVTAVKAGTATITCKGLVKKIERTASSTVTVPPPAWTLTLTPKSGSELVGNNIALTAKAVDSDNVDLGAIDWSSANASIASVSGGKVTCQSAGSTTITAAKTAFGSTKSETASVECRAATPVAVLALDETKFTFDQSTVTKSGRDTLQTVIDAMRRIPSLMVSVEGHTDWYASEGYNAKLAKSRADQVAASLLRLAGKDASAFKSRILTTSFGEKCPVTEGGDREAEPPPANRGRVSADNRSAQSGNRRVEVWQVTDGSGAPTSCRTAAERSGRVPFSSLK